MTKNKLLDCLKELCTDATAHFVLPCAVQKNDTSVRERAPEIHRMRLPKSSDAKKKAPYIIIQFINGQSKNGSSPESSALVRFVFCVYSEDEEDGSVMLLNVMDSVETAILQTVVIGEQFHLDEDEDVESLVYPEDTAPYYAGEMVCRFILPEIRRGGTHEYI